MTTLPPRISYAHMLAQPNPKHIESLVSFFESGCNPNCQTDGTAVEIAKYPDVGHDGGYGVEIEHLPVHNSDDTAVSYYEENGVEALFMRLRPFYDESEEYWENGHLVGLGRSGISLSLEPGGQIETSIGVLRTPQELLPIYDQFRKETQPILHELGFRLVHYGYQPVTSVFDIPVNPKARYEAMTDFLGRMGEFGPCMMRCSASTQISIDYASEQDAIAKMRLGTAVGPILAYFFRNSPYFEGRENPWPLLRQRMWDYMDFGRTNVTPGLFDPRFSWEDYAIDVLSTPLMFADLSHTPEAADLPKSEQYRASFRENAGEVYPDRLLNSYEINHILSTHFNDVRLKNFIEFRHWDSLPIERAESLTQVIGSLFYDPSHYEKLRSFFDGVREVDVLEAKATLQARGGEAQPFGKPMEFWHDFLGVDSTLADVPGDPKHPDVFQH